MATSLSSVVLASLVSAAPALATHGGTHDPKPSAPACEWYGSVEHDHHQPRYENEFGVTQEYRERGSGWSGASHDSTCRGMVQYSYNQYDTSPDGLWWHRGANGTVSATYEAGWAGWGPPGTFAARFTGDETVTMTLTDSSGGHGTQEVPAGTQGGCVVPGADTAAKRAKLQAVVITCSQIQSNDHGETWTATIRMRRTRCDKTIDTDGDDLADCTEFALQTEPHNPDTDGDGLTDGKEVLRYGTDPRDPDTDDGGVGDGAEVAQGTDPLDGTDDMDPCSPIRTALPAYVGRFMGRETEEAQYEAEVRWCTNGKSVRVRRVTLTTDTRPDGPGPAWLKAFERGLRAVAGIEVKWKPKGKRIWTFVSPVGSGKRLQIRGGRFAACHGILPGMGKLAKIFKLPGLRRLVKAGLERSKPLRHQAARMLRPRLYRKMERDFREAKAIEQANLYARLRNRGFPHDQAHNISREQARARIGEWEDQTHRVINKQLRQFVELSLPFKPICWTLWRPRLLVNLPVHGAASWIESGDVPVPRLWETLRIG